MTGHRRDLDQREGRFGGGERRLSTHGVARGVAQQGLVGDHIARQRSQWIGEHGRHGDDALLPRRDAGVGDGEAVARSNHRPIGAVGHRVQLQAAIQAVGDRDLIDRGRDRRLRQADGVSDDTAQGGRRRHDDLVYGRQHRVHRGIVRHRAVVPVAGHRPR